ncbi:AEC family transporter [Sulfurospirillum sp. hDNRA2]|uniref:AEC family transporter n=1 Tax=Sulfurospirillum sp. hDNRA2 TaxID=3237298 RepID=UPI0020B7A319|nr:AEC family transporter [Sulfurospirillum sp. DNRA8]MCP3651933.1 AEC family transporter [Sulfurospirillum sp. DNRA8]MCR1810780.1 AEC family transporter [Sulfurospirillum sp. DNRA8]
MNIALSILAIYVFILLGYIAKKIFKDELAERGMVILSVYFLHPIFSFWGLSTKPISLELLQVPLYYVLFSLLTIAVSFIFARIFFEDVKERSIMTIATAINNTGNLGIPLGIAIFGQESIIYTSMMSVANTLMTYTLGVFFYSAGTSSMKQAFLNIFKLPVIWAAMLAMVLNFTGVVIHPTLFKSLEMGAYCTVVLQLMIFGMYLYNMKLGELNFKLLLHVNLIKFVIMPIMTVWVLFFVLPLEPFVASVIFLELIVPLAVTNVNIAALYDCKPVDVASLILFTSLLFVPFLLIVSFALSFFGIEHFG